ncbi:MAG TPA: O-antigen ligase family protein, partial [Candidatus Saccharimonadales bacterium]|nr:O-antigen ligase family protein [Candidatus Saccharimonadales bacterium]
MKILARQKLFFIFFLSIFIVANIGFSLSPLLALYGWIKVAELAFIAFYLARTITSRVQLIFISFLFAIGAFFESILAIFQYLNQESLNGVFYFFGERAFTGDTPGIANASIDGTLVLRPYGTFSHPNVLAGYLLVSLVMIWSFLLRSTNRWIQLFAGLTLLVASIALLLSLGRVAISLWALIVIGIFLRVFVRRMQELHTKLIVLGIFLIALSGIAALHIPRQIVMRFSQTSLFEQSVTERTELLTASTTMISNHPLLGVGVENFIPALA